MAHHEEQPTAIESVLELLSEHGLGAMAEAMQTLLNEAMKLERSEFLRAAPGERTDERTGYANGFKDKRCGRASASSRCGCRRCGRCRAASRWLLPEVAWSAACAASARSSSPSPRCTSRASRPAG